MIPQRALVLLLSLIAAVAPGVTLAQDPPTPPQRGGVYHRPLAMSPTTLDSFRVTDIYSRTVTTQLFDGLVQFDQALSIKPALAQSWQASRNGLVWTFRLHKGVRFHHGREMTAEDVVYSLTRTLDPQTRWSGASYLRIIRGADAFVAGTATAIAGLRVLDRYTVQLTLTEAAGKPFLLALAGGHATILPRELVAQQGDRFGARPVGTGPFQFVTWVPGHRIVLAANPTYFEGRPYLDQVEYHLTPGGELDDAFRAFERGELHDTPIPASVRSRVAESAQYTLVRGPHLGIAFLGLRTSTKPLDDPRVRQALNYALDRAQLIREVYRGRFAPGAGILPPGTYGYDPHFVGYPHDPAKAAELLAAAGYPQGEGLPVLPLWSSRRDAEVVTELETIVRHWAAVGVRAEIHYNLDWADFKAHVYAGAYPLFRMSWYASHPGPEVFLGCLLESTSQDNMTQFRDPAIDALLARARGAREWPQKLPLYQEIERRAIAQAPFIVLYSSAYERLFQRSVHGVEINALGDAYMPMKKVWLQSPGDK
jgi:oligopeptide transport system substrate-binding protein